VEIITLHPTFVIGPTLIKEENSSIAAFAKFLRGEVPGVPRAMFPCVDVRDVGYGHYKALITPNINGERILLT